MITRDIECLSLVVDSNDRDVDIGVLYRNTNADVHTFAEHISKITKKTERP